ncbi:MAG: VanW family protein [Promicromonosporaceae bacterium]|nr:VanW family protein [Promicromonosporaceae bacterium]
MEPRKGGTKAMPVIVPPTSPAAGPVAIPATSKPEPEPAEKRGTWKRYVFVSLVVLILAAMYSVAAWSLQDRVPTGTTVAGVGIGEMSSEEALARLNQRLGDRLESPITLQAGEGTYEVTPAEAGLSFDAEATVAGLTRFSLNPQRLWRHLVGTSEVEPVVSVDAERLAAVSASIADFLNIEPVDGTVRFVGAGVEMTEARDGAIVSPEAIAAALRENWLTADGPVVLDYQHLPATIGAAATQAAYEEALGVVAGPVAVTVAGQSMSLSVSSLVSAASVVERGDHLALVFEGEALAAEIIAATDDLIVEPTDAYFTFPEGTPVIAGGDPGTILDEFAVAEAVQRATRTEEREAGVQLFESEPRVTVAQLESLGVTERVSEFSTPHTADQTRTNNLRRGSELVTGIILLPGDTFSITEALSPIDAANGFGQASVIINGRFQPGMGGGLSQLATNMYNVAYFAGFEIVERQPHSVFLSMYPPGREATFNTSAGAAFDMRFRNNTPYPAVINSWVAEGRQFVEIWGTPHFRVETEATPRVDIVPAQMNYDTSPDCRPRAAGQPGFSITNTRRVFLLSDNSLVEEDSFTWTYRPDNGWTCSAPPEG